VKQTKPKLNKAAAEREALYNEIIGQLQPLQRKYGDSKLRWALNRWAKHQREIASLTAKQKEIAEKLAKLRD
jgi:hypothetical protein